MTVILAFLKAYIEGDFQNLRYINSLVSILKVLGKKPLPFISISSQLISCPDNKSMDFITQKKMGIFNATPSVASLLIWSLLNFVYSGTKSSSFSTALQASL